MLEPPPSNSRLSCSRLLAPRMQFAAQILASESPVLRSRAPPPWTSPAGLGLHSLFRLQEQRRAFIRPASRSLAPSARRCGNLETPRLPSSSPRAWVNSGRALPSPTSACRALQPGEENRGPSVQLLPQNSRAGHPTADVPCVLCFHLLLTFGYRTWRMWSAPRPLFFLVPRCQPSSEHCALRPRLAVGFLERKPQIQVTNSASLDPHGQLPEQAGTFAIIPSRRAHRLVGEASEPPANSVPSSSLPDSARPSCPPCPSTQT